MALPLPTARDTEKRPSLATQIIIYVALVAAIFAVYAQVATHQFISLDDDAYIISNPHVTSGFSTDNVIWAFSSFDFPHWQPVTWLSHMLDVQLFGMSSGAHHLTNVVLHAASALVLLMFLFRATGSYWQSVFVAFIFALHPLHVESVAWAAERKDVLSALFCFLALLSYTRFVNKQASIFLHISFIFFILGLMTKPMVVITPALLLLLDFWPLNRFQCDTFRSWIRRFLQLLYEKTPYFVFAIMSGILTIYGQNKYGAVSTLGDIPVLQRLENMLTAYLGYIAKTFWPQDLAILYPLESSPALWRVFLALGIIVAISAFAFRYKWRYPYLAVGWLWFLVTLLPVSGLIQVGVQSMADRYAYIPQSGIIIMLAWGVIDLSKNLRIGKWLPVILAITAICASALSTRHQLDYWRDSVTIYRHTLRITKDNFIIKYCLGLVLESEGDTTGAIKEFREALEINPNDTDLRVELGMALYVTRNFDAAIHELRLAAQSKPADPDIKIKLGAVLETSGKPDTALQEYRKALSISPNNSEAHCSLGQLLAHNGNPKAAIAEFREAIRLSPTNKKARNNLGAILAQLEGVATAIEEQQKTLRLFPDDADAHFNLGVSFTQKGMLNDAMQQYREALKLKPDHADAGNNLNLLLAKRAR